MRVFGKLIVTKGFKKLPKVKKIAQSGHTAYFVPKEKSYYMANLLFDWFGFDQASKSVSNSTKAKQLNANKFNRRSFV